MTTPTVCTRTDPHPPHRPWGFDVGYFPCPGVPTPSYGEEQAAHVRATTANCDCDVTGPHEVPDQCGWMLPEPPADVQATPDPRLDVVKAAIKTDRFLSLRVFPAGHETELAQRILDTLDDLAGTMHEPDPGQDAAIYREGWQAGYRSGTGDLDDMRDQRDRARGTLVADRYQAMIAPDPRPVRPSTPPPTPPPSGGTPAPAGLSAAQEIRLRLAVAALSDRQVSEDRVAGEIRALEPWAAWVEHGDDETPYNPMPDLRRLADQRNDAVIRATEAEARADLYEARLGQVLGVLHRLDDNGKVETTEFYTALAWTPDDTAPVLPYVTEAIDAAAELAAMSQPHTAPAGAATGDGSTLPRVLEYRTKEAPDGDA